MKKIVHAVAVASIVAGSLAGLPGAASARDWNRDAGHGGFEGARRDPSLNRWGEVRHDRWRNTETYETGEGYRHHHDHAGRAIALGAFAAILGLALAAESRRVQHDAYDYDN